MSSWDFSPGINNVKFEKTDKNKDGEINIRVNFTLFGLNRLVGPIDNDKRYFYLYIFLVYYEGGRNFEIISSSRFYCDDSILDNGSVEFTTNLSVPEFHNYSTSDFILNYHSLEIVYSEQEPEDGSDINGLLWHPTNSLFRTKLDIGIECE